MKYSSDYSHCQVTLEPSGLHPTLHRMSTNPPASKKQRSSSSPPPSSINVKSNESLQQVNQTLAHARSKVSLLINHRQQANPLLRHIRHVRKEFHNGLSADFICGPTTCCLFLSLQYHQLHPNYIFTRVKKLGNTAFRLRILLVLVDVADHRVSLHQLTKLSLVERLTIVCAGSEREAARYLETFRSYDSKGAELIQERVGNDYGSRLNAALSSIRGINKTDVSTLAFTFGSVKNIATASKTELRNCPGMGERKVQRLYAALHQPFRTDIQWLNAKEKEEREDENLDNRLIEEEENEEERGMEMEDEAINE